jgi:hypothetical protein
MIKQSPLTARDEEILRAVGYYRYITKLDILHLFFKKTLDTYVRAKLSDLSGKTNLDTHNYLCRFNLPAVHKKSQEKVYVLGSRGRQVLRELGLPVDWYFRPHKLKFLSYSYVLHNLILTRTMIAADHWARHHPDYALIDKRICYELSGKVVPDGWLLFEETTPEGVYEQPVILELDRGMENKHQFRTHVRGRINYIQSGEYKKIFKTDVATIAYLTTGQTPEYRETRRKAMCLWVHELLKEMRLESWAGVFRIASVEFPTLYDYSLFESDVWHKPDSSSAVRLFN